MKFLSLIQVNCLKSRKYTLKRISQNRQMLLASADIFEASSTNSIDPDQTWSWSTLFASILMLTNKQTFQGRRCVFKSGPAEETFECRRHEGGGGVEHERGDYSRSRKGGLGASPEKFLNFERFYVRF